MNTDGKGNRLDTISKRNHAAAREIETLFWRCMCDNPAAAVEYISEDAVIINPLFNNYRSSKPLHKESDPTLVQVLENAEPWSGFRIHGDPGVVEVDLMAVALVYKVSLYRQSKKGGMREVVASASSTWRQTAGADWLLVAHHVGYAEEEDE